MSTRILSKQDFIEIISNSISDNEVVLMALDLNSIELKPKLNAKRVTFSFAADAFLRNKSVGDLMNARTLLFSAFACDISILSEGVRKLINADQ